MLNKQSVALQKPLHAWLNSSDSYKRELLFTLFNVF